MATQAETLEWHKKRWGQRSSDLRESFTEDYVLLLFLPMEGSVDKAELEAFNDELEELENLGCQVRKHLN